MGLILTLALGLFIILGAGIVFLTKNNQKFIQFSISLAFSVMVMLILVDLLPEAWECLGQEQTMWSTILILGICIVVGFVILLGLDQFIPDHEEKKGKQEEQNHMKHIGLVSSIALVIHNLMEGMAISLLVTNDLRAGLLAGIGFTMSMFVANLAYQTNAAAIDLAKISILLASLIAATLGMISLWLNTSETKDDIKEED